MSDAIVWSVLCDADHGEQQVILYEAEGEPTKCPSDATHGLVEDATVEINRISQNTVKVQDESTPTGGFFHTTSFRIDVPAVVGTHEFDVSRPINVNLFNMKFHSEVEHAGDSMDVAVRPDTVIGAIGAPVTTGDTVLTVSPTVLEHIKVGFYVNLTDGAKVSHLGRCIEINKETSQITVETAADADFSHASPTYVRIRIHMMYDYLFGTKQVHAIGDETIDASYLPKGTVIRFYYHNSTAEAKKLIVYVVYKY